MVQTQNEGPPESGRGAVPPAPTGLYPDYARLIYRRDVIRGVRDRWKEQYAKYDPKHRFPCGLTVAEVSRNLERLDLETARVADVVAAMQISDWASLECDGCGTDVEVLVRIGQEPDYDARWLDLCASCLSQARALLDDGAGRQNPAPRSVSEQPDRSQDDG